MRTRLLVLAAAMMCSAAGVSSAQTVVGSGFTYQGMFADNGAPANGNYDFEFALFAAEHGGSAVQTVTQAGVVVNGGLINTLIDFGGAVFDGQAKWVEVRVRQAGSGGAYTVLAPRQALTAVPYALGLPMPFQRNVSTGDSTALQITKVDSGGIAINGVAMGTNGTGVRGQSLSDSGFGGDGVRGLSSRGYGIHGVGDVGGWFQGGRIGLIADGDSSYGRGILEVNDFNAGPIEGDLIKAFLVSAGIVFRVNRSGYVFANGGYITGGADLAEYVPSSGQLEAGDVVEIDAAKGEGFQLSSHSNSTSVAGVISTRPGVSLNGSASPEEIGKDMPRLALAGRVPVKVTTENGAIHAGDLLVSSSRPGHAMRAPESPRAGTVIGKAMKDLDADAGEIEMLVMLR